MQYGVLRMFKAEIDQELLKKIVLGYLFDNWLKLNPKDDPIYDNYDTYFFLNEAGNPIFVVEENT